MFGHTNHPKQRSFPVSLGPMTGRIYGGPYRERPGHMVGIKLAPEVRAPAAYEVPIVDFGVPSEYDMQQALQFALNAISKGATVYVGCMGGIGRTGTFLSCFQKFQYEVADLMGYSDDFDPDPVKEVRAMYLGHAVETKGQREFISAFNVHPVVEFWLERIAPSYMDGWELWTLRLSYRASRLAAWLRGLFGRASRDVGA